ncbi:tetratricopeptide repeat protein [Tateyamaria sp. SN6-1]|uniref:tetratricopeptide repeat protein n=1 Tax=Tateyamaria sp. SN6-1 TaxID=3092148 RepID=UPI0039F52099
MRIAIILALVAGPVWAETCPQARDISVELSALFEEARTASDPASGQAVSGKMWELWLDAPDDAAQEILDRGMAQRASFDFVGALESFDTLIAYCPDYAEGYNQRAFVHFLSSNYSDALIDLDRALTLSPDHVGAQSGRALTLMNQGKITAARTQMLAAIDNNPWLSERALLADGAPLGPVGEEL